MANLDPCTKSADELHDAAHRVVTSMMTGDDHELIYPDQERADAMEAARIVLSDYLASPASERTEAADVLAEALAAFLQWPKDPERDQREFGIRLYALEMTRYQYGGDWDSPVTSRG